MPKVKSTCHYANYTHSDASDELALGDFFQLLAYFDLTVALHVERLVNDGLGEQLAHVLLVLLPRHVQSVRVLRHDFATSVNLRTTV